MRDRYFDTLRAVAIVRVVSYHAFHVAPLALAFPSMGVMFALGGSLMAASLDRSGAHAIKGRLRRLLPALWVMGLVLVPLMLAGGWVHKPAWPRLLLWVLPLATPPAGHDIGNVGAEGAGVLWYLATYLWLVLWSPLLLRFYRRWPLVALAAAPVALAVLPSYPFAAGNAITHTIGNVLVFLPCWLLGFAHRDGALNRARPAHVGLIALASCVLSLGWVIDHHGHDHLDLLPHPLAHALYSIGFVLALLRWTPRMAWLARRPLLDSLVTAINRRAVTIYLWHNVMITIAIIIGDGLHLWNVRQGLLIYAAFSTIALTLIAVTVLALGWVEDVAAARPATIWPFAPTQPLAPSSAEMSALARAVRPVPSAAETPALAGRLTTVGDGGARAPVKKVVNNEVVGAA